MEVNLL